MTQIELDGGWSITGHINGGYLTSVCGQVASEVLDGAHPLTVSGWAPSRASLATMPHTAVG